jgi:hypothetical protein
MSSYNSICDYLTIKKFELYYYFQLTKLNAEDGRVKYLYNFSWRSGKHTNVYTIKYHKNIEQYEYDGHRFLTLNDLINNIYSRFS